jgi:hypothetical protein
MEGLREPRRVANRPGIRETGTGGCAGCRAILRIPDEQLTREDLRRGKDSEDVDWPWIAAAGKAVWRLRLNDFPEDPMYTLFVDGNEVGDFNGWPEPWQR